MQADLRGCDLRRSIFRDCEFYDAILNGADLRGTRFVDCRFSDARMQGARLERTMGLFTGARRRELRLSKDQAKQVDWVSSAGPDPWGG